MIQSKLYTLLIVIFAFNITTAQIGINNQSPDPSAALDITSANKGILIPQYTLASLSDITSPVASPAEGSLIYNTGGAFPKGNYYWTGAQWEKLYVNNEYDQILKVEHKGTTVVIPDGVTADNIVTFDNTGIINTIAGLTFAGGSVINLPAGTYKIDVSFDCYSPTSTAAGFITINNLYIINAAIVDNSATPVPLTDVKVSSTIAEAGTTGSIQGYKYSFVLTLAATTAVRLRLNHNDGASNSSPTNLNSAGIIASFYKFL